MFLESVCFVWSSGVSWFIYCFWFSDWDSFGWWCVCFQSSGLSVMIFFSSLFRCFLMVMVLVRIFWTKMYYFLSVFHRPSLLLHFLARSDTLCPLIGSSLACVVLPAIVVWCVALTCLIRHAVLFHLVSLNHLCIFCHPDIPLSSLFGFVIVFSQWCC